MEEKVGKDETDTDEEKDDSADVMDMPPIPKMHHLEDDGDDKPRKKESVFVRALRITQGENEGTGGENRERKRISRYRRQG